jgi:phosphopantothenate synthetase
VQAVRAVYDGRVFVPERPVNAEKNQAAIITILDEVLRAENGKSYVRYAGQLSDERRAELEEILESTRGVDSNEW